MPVFELCPIDLEFACVGLGKQVAYHDGLEVARIHPTNEGDYLVEFSVMGIDIEDTFLPNLTAAQFLVWGAVAARLSGTMLQAVRAAEHAHVH